MSETKTDEAVTTEQAVVTDSATGEVVATDTGADGTEVEGGEVMPSAEEQAAKAEADAKAAAEAEAEKARIEQAVEEFKAVIGTYETDEASPDFGKALSGILASEDRDITTGQLPDGVLNDLRAKFNEVPAGAARSKIKQWNDAQISVAMDDARLIGIARSLFLIKKVVLVAAAGNKGTAAPKVAVDPTEAFVAQMLGAYMAPYMAKVPEGVAANWSELVNAQVTGANAELAQSYAANMDKLNELPADDAENATDETKAQRAELTATTEKAPEFIKAGFRLIRGRSVNASAAKKGRPAKSADGTPAAPRAPRASGSNKSTGAHIVEALASVPVGQVMSVADIVNFRSNEYGDEKPSPGAVSARLFPGTGGGDGDKCTLPNIKGVLNSTGNKAGVRTA